LDIRVRVQLKIIKARLGEGEKNIIEIHLLDLMTNRERKE
jgi:hypothetical protein